MSSLLESVSSVQPAVSGCQVSVEQEEEEDEECSDGNGICCIVVVLKYRKQDVNRIKRIEKIVSSVV